MIKFLTMMTVVIAAIFMIVTGAKAGVVIVVDVSEQIMYVETPEELYEWEVSTGRKGYSTPRGAYKPYLLKRMHYSSKYDNAPMPHSIFFHGGYAIHATNDLKRLGRPASHGCVRLHPQNARWLYTIIQEFGKDQTEIYIVD